MRILPLINSLLLVGFLSVLAGAALMVAGSGYNDKVSHTMFIVHATNGFLLLARAAFKSDEPSVG